MVERVRLEVTGTVQGVGFRPHAYRLAARLDLRGFVRNDGWGVCIELEGERPALDAYAARLVSDAPPAAQVANLTRSSVPVEGTRELTIQPSAQGGGAAGVQADMAPCADCLRELFDPSDRRYRYPFLSCTQCGPRFTILERLPYDRAGTTMRAFPLCAACQAEFDDPSDRRFHAQPLACPECGPQLALWNPAGDVLATREDALAGAIARVASGGIVALKGRGGFQLVCRADDAAAVRRVRSLKRRAKKPLAVMVRDLPAARRACLLGPGEETLLTSLAAPILLARARPSAEVCDDVAPGLPTLGVMLPSTPLHHLLMAALEQPLLVTSGNRPGDPMLTEEAAAQQELAPGVDALLVHDRVIANLADDSVVRWAAGRPLLLRRARGYVPRPVPLGVGCHPTHWTLAHGGHLKATLALGRGGSAWVSPHVGDLDSPRARAAYEAVESALLERRAVAPATSVCDLHPDYATTHHAEAGGRRLVRVQHHEAHVLAVLAEHEVALPVLGIAWDGTGYGSDQTVWGGEAFEVTAGGCRRVARLRPFPLPGGERAIREPRRAALGVLWALDPGRLWEGSGREVLRGAFTGEERRVLPQALARGVNAPRCSSVGRLFDAVASLVGLRQRIEYEAEAAAGLEHSVDPAEAGAYPFAVSEGEALHELDWGPAIEALLDDVAADAPLGVIAARFHRGLAEGIVALAAATGHSRLVLSGGCFLNRVLLETAIERLRAAGFEVHWPRLLPPGDGGLALGQLAAAARRGC